MRHLFGMQLQRRFLGRSVKALRQRALQNFLSGDWGGGVKRR